MNYARWMLKRRIKIDVGSQGMPEHSRGQIRERLIEEYLRYPSRRVLFFVKRVRIMIFGHENEDYFKRPRETWPAQPEDIIAQGKQRYKYRSAGFDYLFAQIMPSLKHYIVR